MGHLSGFHVLHTKKEESILPRCFPWQPGAGPRYSLQLELALYLCVSWSVAPVGRTVLAVIQRPVPKATSFLSFGLRGLHFPFLLLSS